MRNKWNDRWPPWSAETSNIVGISWEWLRVSEHVLGRNQREPLRPGIQRGKSKFPTEVPSYISTVWFGLEQIQEEKQQTWDSCDNLPKLENFLRLQQSGEVFMVVLWPRVPWPLKVFSLKYFARRQMKTENKKPPGLWRLVSNSWEEFLPTVKWDRVGLTEALLICLFFASLYICFAHICALSSCHGSSWAHRPWSQVSRNQDRTSSFCECLSQYSYSETTTIQKQNVVKRAK